MLPYDAFVFLNCGVRGPFFPVYMPRGWHWTDGFLERLSGLQGGDDDDDDDDLEYKESEKAKERSNRSSQVALVGTSLVCLKEKEAPIGGGVGPRVEVRKCPPKH